MNFRFPLLLAVLWLVGACGGSGGGGAGSSDLGTEVAADLGAPDGGGDLGTSPDGLDAKTNEVDPGLDTLPGDSDPQGDLGGDGCVAQCDGRVCGDDGCGGSCGTCDNGKVCLGGGQCGVGQDWTVLVYLVADNDLEAYSFPNLEEMMVASAQTNVKIVVQADWVAGMDYRDSDSWMDRDYKNTWRLLMKPAGYDKLADLGEKNMANPATLSDFVTFGLENYPAQHYALILWDHGGGLLGFGWDETSDQDALLPAELADAVAAGLEGAGLPDGAKLDLVGFDACLMGSVETANLLAPVADYLVASEELEGGPGWDYRVFGALEDGDGAPALGSMIIEGFMTKSINEFEDTMATLSLVDLAAMEALTGALEGLVGALGEDLGTHGAALAVAQSKAQYFGLAEYEDEWDSGQVDLGDLVDLLKSEAPGLATQTAALLEALAAAVVDEGHASGVPGATGLAIHFPVQAAIFERDLLIEARPPQFWVDFLDNWYAWLGDNYKVQLSEVLYDPSGSDDEFEWIELYNSGSLPVDLSGWSLGWGGSNLDQGHFQLDGVLQPGACVVVGGPQSTAANGSPSFFQAEDFGSDLQNSGSPGDAVGLFNVPSKDIQPNTVPFDAVIYGADNGSQLLDETGKVGAVDVADAPQGSSVERSLEGWKIQAAPSPGTCLLKP